MHPKFIALFLFVLVPGCLIFGSPVSATTPSTICSAAGYGASNYYISDGSFSTGTCSPDAQCTSSSDYPAWGYGNYTIYAWVSAANCQGGCGSNPCFYYVTTYTYAAPTPTPTPNTSVCAQACGYHFVVPSASGSLAETCFLTLNQNCLFCQDLLHLMSEAQQFAPCSGTEPNVTPTATPTPVPTATPEPYPTSTFLPNVTFAPHWVPTIAHISGGIDMGDVKGKIINSTGPLGNFSAFYLDWIDGIVVQAAGPICQVFELVDTPMKWIIDLADTILGIIESLVDEYLAYAEVPLEIIKMAVNSFPDKLKGLILYAMGWRLLLIGWKGL